MENSFTNISEKDKQIIKAVAPLAIILILFIFAGKFGISQISSVRSKIKDMEKKQSTLTQKWNILRSISQVSSNWADLTLYALPKTNPSLQYLSQLRLLAAENGLILSDVKVSSGGETAGNLSAINGSFSVLGAKESITSFCQSLGRMAPLTVISKIDLSDGGGASKADIGTRTFYASLPKTIPSVSQSITDLTASEKELITEIESLSTPAIGQTFTPSTEGITSAPFGE